MPPTRAKPPTDSPAPPPDVAIRAQVRAAVAKAQAEQYGIEDVVDCFADMVRASVIETVCRFLADEAAHAAAKAGRESAAARYWKTQSALPGAASATRSHLSARAKVHGELAKAHGGYARIFELRAEEYRKNA